MQYVFGILMFLISLFLILLILVQRGRGGGLAGAFGGMGGQSAFGTKAGDLFTRITIGVAALWIVLSVGAIKVLNRSQSVFGEGGQTSSTFSDKKSTGPSTPASGAGTGESATTPSTTSPATPGVPAATAPAPGSTAPTSPAPVSSAPATPPSADVKAESQAPAAPAAEKK
jgi:preprotein translocase subunit SecG